MKIRALLYLIPLLGICDQTSASTTVTLVCTNQLPLPSLSLTNGQVAKVVSLFSPGSAYGYLTLSFSSGNSASASYSFNGPGPFGYLPLTVAGPVTISLAGGIPLYPTFCTIEVCSQGDSFVPSTAVVIPADSAGPVNIILESSVDMINWTAALPGIYGTTTSNRFFRVRAQRTQ